eukprot:1926394-Rhodomonas_salina.8
MRCLVLNHALLPRDVWSWDRVCCRAIRCEQLGSVAVRCGVLRQGAASLDCKSCPKLLSPPPQICALPPDQVDGPTALLCHVRTELVHGAM